MPITLDDSGFTIDTLVAEVYTHLEPSSFGYLNRLAAAVTTNTATTMTFEFANQAAIRPATYLCIDLEVVYVWDVDETTNMATVQRGMLQSTATTHDTGALVQIQPRASKFDVVRQIRHDIRSWPAALFAVDSLSFAEAVNARAYDLAVDASRILEVWTVDTADNTPRRSTGWRFEQNADVAVYPSGQAIVFPWGGTTGRTVEVVYAKPFNTDDLALDTSLADIGLEPSMYEIPVLGAAARLVREAPRTDTRAQGQSRLAEEVPPTHLLNTSKDLMRRRDDRIHTEIARLRERFPQRRG